MSQLQSFVGFPGRQEGPRFWNSWGLLNPVRLFPEPQMAPDLCPGEKASTLGKHHERPIGCRPDPEVNYERTVESYIHPGAMVKT